MILRIGTMEGFEVRWYGDGNESRPPPAPRRTRQAFGQSREQE